MSNENIVTDPVDFAKALADPTRQQIMQLCCCEWMNVGDIAEAVAVSQPTVSHHLAILRDAQLVDIRHEGKHSYCQQAISFSLLYSRIRISEYAEAISMANPELDELNLLHAMSVKRWGIRSVCSFSMPYTRSPDGYQSWLKI